jgi:methanethiol S-methyltransferase
VKIAFGTFAIASYLFAIATVLYAIVFVGGFGSVGGLTLTRTIDVPAGVNAALAILIDSALIGIFAVQHSLMARPAFKRTWTQRVPSVIERSGYVLASALALCLLFTAWQPLPSVLWDWRGSALGTALTVLYGVGWALALFSTFIINHFELFGLSQVWRHLRNQPTPTPRFQSRFLYRIVRHPIMLGFLLAFWCTPLMTYGHLLFAVLMTVYTLMGIRFEERDLSNSLGADYRAYRERVPMLLPSRKAVKNASLR